jgi:hypothetical protein
MELLRGLGFIVSGRRDLYWKWFMIAARGRKGRIIRHRENGFHWEVSRRTKFQTLGL